MTQKLESNKMLLERQNKEWKMKYNELETNQRTKTKAVIATLEMKITNLEEQLEAETKWVDLKSKIWNINFPKVYMTFVFTFCSFRERQQQQKNNRKLDKKLKDCLMQLDDERRHAEQYKEQVEKVSFLG